jgi:uncharacterized protein (DUF779 family)
MSAPLQGCSIAISPVARDALARLRRQHGEIILHVTGGCCDARTPLCLPEGELRLGARDILLGEVAGVRVYEMQSTPEICNCCGAYLLDMVPGVPVGFSLDPGQGMRFAIREVMAGCCDDNREATKIPSQLGDCAQ